MTHRLALLYRRIKARGVTPSFAAFAYWLNRECSVTTGQKLVNLLGCKVGRALRLSHVWGLPYRYYIDPMNVCVLRCPLCPTGTGKLKRPRGKMELASFKKLIDQIAKVAYIIYLYNWGEPFLHPDIFEMIAYASANQIFVRISSNLNAFTPDMASQVIDSGLSQLVVSIDGACQETYETYRKGGNLAKVLANLQAIVQAKHAAGAAYPRIGVRMLVTRYNEHEISLVRERVTELGINTFSIGPIFVDPRRSEDVKQWVPLNSSLSAYGSTAALQNVWHCADLWESCAIHWDGGVLPCCWLHDPKDDLGNVFEQPLSQIWNNDFYVSSRMAFRRFGKRRGAGMRKTVCTQCRGYPEYDY